MGGYAVLQQIVYKIITHYGYLAPLAHNDASRVVPQKRSNCAIASTDEASASPISVLTTRAASFPKLVLPQMSTK